MRFDNVEYQILDNPENEEELVPAEFEDSLEVYLKYGVYINTSGSHLVKKSEFLDKKGEVESAIFASHSGSTKTTIGIEVISLDPDKDINDFSEEMNQYFKALNEKGGDENINIIREAKKISCTYFKGLEFGSIEENGIAISYLAKGLWVKEGRICKIFYIITDTLGNKIYYDQELKNFILFLDKITLTEYSKKASKTISKEHETMLIKMQIGLNWTKCYSTDSDKKCLQLFVENIGNFSLINVTSEAFEKANKHEDKGFIIPYIPNINIKMIFNNGTETIEHPFTIPKLTE